MALIPFVNVKQGSQSQPRFSRGNTLPLTQLPFAMAGFTPQTDGGRGNWFYHPDDRSLEGVRLTHQPSPWVGDYGHFLLMPQCGEPQADRARRWSGYRPEEAVLRPDYLQLDFLRYQALLELTPAENRRMRLSPGCVGPAAHRFHQCSQRSHAAEFPYLFCPAL